MTALSGYQLLNGAYDELFEAPGVSRSDARSFVDLLTSLASEQFQSRQAMANFAFRKGGVTFTVYSNDEGTEKIFPFDLIPRPVSSLDWAKIERGLKQRVAALNAFLLDIYGKQRILAEGKIPRELVEGSHGFLRAVVGIKPPGGVYVHVSGIDLIRDPSGEFVVLEDNIRTPSGVSYVLENREVMKRVYPEIFARSRVRPVSAYPYRLRDALLSLSPRAPEESRLVVLTPGPFNSAYFEHAYLARGMGVELVQGSDLFVANDRVYVKTTQGALQVDVIYRRIDDEFIDPSVFRADSHLGVPGLVRAYERGNVTLANALGNGVADDKALYPYVPDMIRFYLSEEPLIKQVETYSCSDPKSLDYVQGRLEKLVVKAVDASGGYGMLFGPTSSKAEREEFRKLLLAEPRRYIAQPVIELSTCATLTDDAGVAARRVDLRPFVVTGRTPWVLPGGLTRVALVEGSYVVNSSQGGGSKDTWVVEEQA